MLARWLAAYRSDVAADLADLHEPLAALQTAVSPAAPVTEAAWLAHAQEEAVGLKNHA
jgi:hypothetical protein